MIWDSLFSKTYASQTWLPSRSNLHEFEKVQHHATKWILNSNQSYRNGLVTLKLLPLSLYVEMRDLLLLLSIIRGDYGVVINDIEKAVETTRQTERGEYRITKARINKTNNNVFRRSKLLFNYVSRVANDYGTTVNIITLQKMYWNFFTNYYVEENKFTWRRICRCGNCNILKKIKLI